MDQTKRDIRALVHLFEQSDWDEMRVETSDLKLAISRNSTAPGLTVAESVAESDIARLSSAPDAVKAATEDTPEPIPEGLVAVTAPNLGTFWRAPKPGADPYVEIGQKIQEDTTVCLIEVMKLFTPAVSGVSGTIVKVVVEDGTMVEFGDTLMFVDPST